MLKVVFVILFSVLLFVYAPSFTGDDSKGSCALVAYTFDDGFASHHSIVMPLLDKYGVKAGFAVIPGRVGRPGRLNWDQVHALQEAGHEILNHSYNHVNLSRPGNVSWFAAAEDILRGRLVLLANGIDARVYVAPNSKTADDYMFFVRALHRSAYTVSNRKSNDAALWGLDADLMKLHRLRTDTTSLQDIKSTIDLLKNRGGFLTLYHHDVSPENVDKVTAIIEYGLQAGATFTTPSAMAEIARGGTCRDPQRLR